MTDETLKNATIIMSLIGLMLCGGAFYAMRLRATRQNEFIMKLCDKFEIEYHTKTNWFGAIDFIDK